jgi:DoxX-like protein
MRIAGWILTILIALFMLVDGVGHTMQFAPYVKGTVDVGYPRAVILPIGITELVITILYLIPATNIVGAILLTAYYGGATATHVRAGQAFWIPIVFGILTWLALWLRDPVLRNLTPLRRVDS